MATTEEDRGRFGQRRGGRHQQTDARRDHQCFFSLGCLPPFLRLRLRLRIALVKQLPFSDEQDLALAS